MKPIPPRFFKGRREEILKVLIEELTGWDSTTKVSTDEILRLTDRLVKIK